MAVVPSATPASKTIDLSIKNYGKDNQLQKESKSAVLTQDKKVKTLTKTQNTQPTQIRVNNFYKCSV